MQENIEQLILEGAKVKVKMAELSDRLKQISTVLDQAAEFKDGSKTGYLVGGGFKVKVVRRDNTRWDQQNLKVMRGHFKQTFFEAFKIEFKPKSAKELEKQMLLNAKFEKAVKWARTVTPGASNLTFEQLEGGE